MKPRHPLLIAASGLVAAGAAVLLPAAAASAATPTSVVKSGHCSGTSVDNLQVQREDTGRLSVDYGVDMARHIRGVVWKVTESDNGTTFVSTSVRTIADGSFSVTRVIVPRPGTNTIVGTATSALTGETCKLTASI
jgi:hypothetical protein